MTSSSSSKSQRQMLHVGSIPSSSMLPTFTGRGQWKCSASGTKAIASSEDLRARIRMSVSVSMKHKMILATRRIPYETSLSPWFRGVLNKYHMSSVMARPHRTSGTRKKLAMRLMMYSKVWPGRRREHAEHRWSLGIRRFTHWHKAASMGISLTAAMVSRSRIELGERFRVVRSMTSTCRVGTTTAASTTQATRTEAFPRVSVWVLALSDAALCDAACSSWRNSGGTPSEELEEASSP
mmetsp:Transcript_32894/g.59088  ORF Transcript_32894/g.59088 Transcript_32894/m.59088 type:complete len:238 (-) Transcript_32894:43-756(-)